MSTAGARPLAEAATVVLAVLAITWRVGDVLPFAPAARRAVPLALGALVAVVLVASWLRAREGPAALGLAPAQWRRGWPALAAFTGIATAALAALGLALGTASTGAARSGWLLGYLPGLAAQQLLLQGLLNNRLHEVALARAPARATAFAAAGSALVFAALHAPNPALVAGTLAAGAFWAWHFRVYQNLPALLVSHLVLGAAAMASLGPGPLLDLRVGPPALERLLGS